MNCFPSGEQHGCLQARQEIGAPVALDFFPVV